MDLKELMRDRESFNHKVFEGSRDDLANLGLELSHIQRPGFLRFAGDYPLDGCRPGS